MATSKSIGLLAAGAGLIIGGYAYASPYIAINGIRTAAQEGDTKKLKKMIDFPEVRSSMKEQIKSAVTIKMTKELSDNPFAAFGMAMVGGMVDNLVDDLVTPTAIKAMLVDGKTPQEAENSTKDDSTTNQSSSSNQSWGYTGINTFEVKSWDPENKVATVSFIMERQGIGGWILNDVEFSPEVFAD